MSLWQRLTKGVIRQRAHSEWTHSAFANDAKSLMTWPITDHFHMKQGRSTGRLILPSANEKNATSNSSLAVYLKRHWQFHWWRRLLATLWPSRNWSPAAQEWNNLAWAQKNNIPVPEPMAMGELIGPWFGLRSYLAVRELEFMLPLHEAVPLAARLMTADQFCNWKRTLIREMVHLTKIMHDQHRYHKDLYLCHFFVPIPQATDTKPRTLHLIDFHRLGHHPINFLRWQIKDLAQLLYSTWSIPEITNRDRLRFFYSYLGKAKLTAMGKLLGQIVLWKAKRYAKHNNIALPQKQDEQTAPSLPITEASTSRSHASSFTTEAKVA